MARVRKEGGKARVRKPAPVEEVAPAEEPPAEPVAEEPARLPDPVPGDNADALQRIVEHFQKKYPEEWTAIHLCPMENVFIHMLSVMRG